MQFLAELVTFGVLNIFCFIQILMDIIKIMQHNRAYLNICACIVLEAITFIDPSLVQKHEMEFRNVFDDIGKLVQNQLT